jgi:RecA-family ATPase
MKITPTFDGIAEVDVLNHVEKGKAPTGIFSASELLSRNIESIPCLLEPILPKVGLIGLAGSSDTGKSSLLRQLAIWVCVGYDKFLGFQLNSTHRKAIYCSTEDDDFAVSFLLNRANRDLNLTSDKFNGLTFIFDTHNLLEKLEKILSANRVDLIVIDAFTDLYGKSMNDTNQVRTYLNDFSQLAQQYQCLIVFLHHTGKRTEDLIPSKHNLLGSQGFEAKMRLVIELRNDQIEPTKRHLCIVKGNYLPREYKTESFVLDFNENMLFRMTDERRLFEELRADNKVEVKEIVRAMKENGKTQVEIASELKISQATVSRYLNEC